MAVTYRLTQSSKTGKYRFEVQSIDPWNDIWWTASLVSCPQQLDEALRKLEDLNTPEAWKVIA